MEVSTLNPHVVQGSTVYDNISWLLKNCARYYILYLIYIISNTVKLVLFYSL